MTNADMSSKRHHVTKRKSHTSATGTSPARPTGRTVDPHSEAEPGVTSSPVSLPTAFDRTTTLENISPGVFAATFDASWTSLGGVLGGYLVAHVVRAA